LKVGTNIDEIVNSVRQYVFLTGGIGNTSRLRNEKFHQTWPLIPQKTCNVGFVIGKAGYSLGYKCACLQQSLKHDSLLWSVMLDKNGAYRHASFSMIADKAGNLVTLGGNASLMRLTEEYISNQATPKIRQEKPRFGETVYTLAQNQGTWILAEGNITEPVAETPDTRVKILFDSFHGYCGSPLFDRYGHLVGFGAYTEGQDREKDGTTVRNYGARADSIYLQSYPAAEK